MRLLVRAHAFADNRPRALWHRVISHGHSKTLQDCRRGGESGHSHKRTQANTFRKRFYTRMMLYLIFCIWCIFNISSTCYLEVMHMSDVAHKRYERLRERMRNPDASNPYRFNGVCHAPHLLQRVMGPRKTSSKSLHKPSLSLRSQATTYSPPQISRQRRCNMR